MTDSGQSHQAALAQLVDPTTNAPLSTLVQKAELSDGQLRLTLRPARDETHAAQLTELAQGIPNLCSDVRAVSLTWSGELAGRNVAAEDPTRSIKHVILVMSGKGGVGKSTVCTNLALALKRLGYRVGVLDADMYGPSIPTMLGITGRPVVQGKRIKPLERFGVKLMSLGFLLDDPRAAVVWRGPMLHSALMQFVTDVEWGDLDFLLLDMPPGTGDVALTLSQNVRASGAVVVTTPQEVAIQDVYKSVSMTKKVGIEILGVIENQSYFVCGKCDEKHHIFGEGGGALVAQHAAAPLIGQLPIQPSIREWGDAGTPVVQASPGAEISQQFCQIAEKVIDAAEAAAARAPALTIDRGGGTNRHLPIAR